MSHFWNNPNHNGNLAEITRRHFFSKCAIGLGSIALGNEEEALAYGADPKRDTAGVFERIAPFVWRLVIPYPQDGSELHVFELTPVADQPA